MLGYTSTSLEIRDLPILPANMRSTTLFTNFRKNMQKGPFKLPKFLNWELKRNSPVDLLLQLVEANKTVLLIEVALAATAALLFYIPAFFLQRFVLHLEIDPQRKDMAWAWVYCAGLFVSNAIMFCTPVRFLAMQH